MYQQVQEGKAAISTYGEEVKQPNLAKNERRQIVAKKNAVINKDIAEAINDCPAYETQKTQQFNEIDLLATLHEEENLTLTVHSNAKRSYANTPA